MIYSPYFEHAGLDAAVVNLACCPERYTTFLRCVFTMETSAAR